MWLSVVTTIRCSSNSHLPNCPSPDPPCARAGEGIHDDSDQYGYRIIYLSLKVAALYTTVKDAQELSVGYRTSMRAGAQAREIQNPRGCRERSRSSLPLQKCQIDDVGRIGRWSGGVAAQADQELCPREPRHLPGKPSVTDTVT